MKDIFENRIHVTLNVFHLKRKAESFKEELTESNEKLTRSKMDVKLLRSQLDLLNKFNQASETRVKSVQTELHNIKNKVTKA